MVFQYYKKVISKKNNNLFKILVLAAALFALDQSFNKNQPASEVLASNDRAPAYKPAETLPKLKLNSTPAPAGLTAKAYLVEDLDSGKVLASLNADTPLPVASLTKLTTALLVSRSLAPGHKITVLQLPQDLPAPKLGLVQGEVISVASLVEGMLVASANDAAEALGRALGPDVGLQITDLARSLGAVNSIYANATGLDDPGSHSTASDLLKIILEVRRTPWLMSLLSETKGVVKSVDGVYVHKFNTTNRLLRDRVVLGGKTGFTDEARGNLAVFAAAPGGSKLIAILLGSEKREDEMSKLLKWVGAAYQF